MAHMPKAIRISSDCLAETAETSGRAGAPARCSRQVEAGCMQAGALPDKSDPGGWGENKWSHPGKNQTLRELNRTVFGGPNF